MRLISVLAIALLFTIPAKAETKDSVFLLNKNESLLHISATESREVDQDLLIANLRIETENKSIKTVQNDINATMSSALRIAKKYTDVKAITRSYNVHQYDRNRGKKGHRPDMIWKGQQALTLKSKNPEDLVKLAGQIQGVGFVMNGLNYTLSPDVASEVRDDLLEDALIKLSSRAYRAAKALGKSTAEVKEINANDNKTNNAPTYGHARRAMSMSADQEMVAPVASPGETTITMRVTAKVLLR